LICLRESLGDRLDFLDPYAKEISFPPDEVEGTIAASLGLLVDAERREWRFPGETAPSLTCEIWSNKTVSEREEPFRSGKRMSASIELLKTVCAKTGKELIVEVQISRTQHRTYRSRDEQDWGYIPPSHKVFILSSNGILRDACESYKLG